MADRLDPDSPPKVPHMQTESPASFTNMHLPPINTEPPQTNMTLPPISMEPPSHKMGSESQKPPADTSVCVMCPDPDIKEAALGLIIRIGLDHEYFGQERIPAGHTGSTRVVLSIDETLPKHRLEGVIAANMDPKTHQPGRRAGDVVVRLRPPSSDTQRVTRGVLTRAATVLHDEVGSNFHWLLGSSERSPFRVHYDQDFPIDLASHAATEVETVEVDGVINESVRRDPMSIGTITGPSLDDSKMLAAENVIAYTEELIKGIDSPLWGDLESLRGTESVVPVPVVGPLAPATFRAAPFRKWGEATLLVIPTKNKFKTAVLTKKFQENLPEGTVLHTLALPADSGVGEQPYNEAGAMGACQRIASALKLLRTEEHEENRRELAIGTVMVASIENYMRTDGVARPTDHGIVSFYNSVTGTCRMGVSRGVTVSPAYVERAQRYGFEDKGRSHGRVTVGQVMAANVPGLDKADWHKVVAGVSRYDLLTEAVDKMEIPWQSEDENMNRLG